MPPQHCFCPWCGEAPKSKNKLKEHIGSRHGGQLNFLKYPEDCPETAAAVASLIARGKPPSLETKDVLYRLEIILTSDNDEEVCGDFCEFFRHYKKEHWQNVEPNVLEKLRARLQYHGVYTGRKATVQALIDLTLTPDDEPLPEWPQAQFLTTTFNPRSQAYKKQQELKKPKKPQKHTVEKPANHEKKPKPTTKPETKTAVGMGGGGSCGGGYGDGYIESLFTKKETAQKDDDSYYVCSDCADDEDPETFGEDTFDDDGYGNDYDDGGYDDGGYDDGGYDDGGYDDGGYDDYGDDYGDY